MTLLRYAALPLRAPAILTGAKSFRGNPVIGSPALNGRGLHVWRIRMAERMADARRARLTGRVELEHRAAYDRDGFVVVEDALPPDVFERLRAEVEDEPLPAREMRQGGAVTRFVEAPPAVRASRPTLDRFLREGLFPDLLRYAASVDGDPMVYLHCVITGPGGRRRDPQTALHSDTFHACAKGWLFLRDVALEDGPFVYVPGSHRLTEGRIAWERAQSLTAATNPDSIHASGSFRATAEEMRDMGYADPVPLPVRANTLVVADTHGFHARHPAARPSVRPAIYGSLRRNPFLPWTGLDPLSLPGLRGRSAQIFGAWLDLRSRLTGRRNPQPQVGPVPLADPATRV